MDSKSALLVFFFNPKLLDFSAFKIGCLETDWQNILKDYSFHSKSGFSHNLYFWGRKKSK